MKKAQINGFPQFVGFFTAHTVFQIEGGENVIPLIAYLKVKGKYPQIDRVESSSYEDAAATARKRVKELQKESDYILLALDGFLPLEDKKYEAIFIEAFQPKDKETSTMQLAIPYRSAKSKEGLAIYRPKVIETNVPDIEEFFNEFYKGIEVHKEAAKFWNKHLDQSK